jgi:hypothetical protein
LQHGLGAAGCRCRILEPYEECRPLGGRTERAQHAGPHSLHYIAVTPAMAGGGDNKVPMAEFVCLHKLLSD